MSKYHWFWQALVGSELRLDLAEGIAAAAALQPVAVSEECRAAVLDFVTRRLEQLLVDGGCTPEVVRAVLAERGSDPSAAAQSARDLQVLSHSLTEQVSTGSSSAGSKASGSGSMLAPAVLALSCDCAGDVLFLPFCCSLQLCVDAIRRTQKCPIFGH
jgi:hypothetical protein